MIPACGRGGAVAGGMVQKPMSLAVLLLEQGWRPNLPGCSSSGRLFPVPRSSASLPLGGLAGWPLARDTIHDANANPFVISSRTGPTASPSDAAYPHA